MFVMLFLMGLIMEASDCLAFPHEPRQRLSPFLTTCAPFLAGGDAVRGNNAVNRVQFWLNLSRPQEHFWLHKCCLSSLAMQADHMEQIVQHQDAGRLIFGLGWGWVGGGTFTREGVP